MSRHVLRPYICAWCRKPFDTPEGLRAHEGSKHFRSMPLTEEARAVARLREFHRDRERTARVSRAGDRA